MKAWWIIWAWFNFVLWAVYDNDLNLVVAGVFIALALLDD